MGRHLHDDARGLTVAPGGEPSVSDYLIFLCRGGPGQHYGPLVVLWRVTLCPPLPPLLSGPFTTLTPTINNQAQARPLAGRRDEPPEGSELVPLRAQARQCVVPVLDRTRGARGSLGITGEDCDHLVTPCFLV
ncbi:hypothetical protein SKAU_G00182040 [Synaphobranchus kaupii]|uniref:Uncharacterized protein n=1 Tax=Synaphobranchus kaupii TaxID=118154 RepID=A0A9Q1FBS5_SYNKA|nr:hypothetical protein SKAU_G00182040 [Synaphobranchus kaupii]